jgi:hypothetical protein
MTSVLPTVLVSDIVARTNDFDGRSAVLVQIDPNTEKQTIHLNSHKMAALFAATLAAVETIHKHKRITDLCIIADGRAEADRQYDPREDRDLIGQEDAETVAYLWANHAYSYAPMPMTIEERFYEQIHAIATELAMFSNTMRTQYMVCIVGRMYSEIPHLSFALWLFIELYFDPASSPELFVYSNRILEAHRFTVDFYIPIQGSPDRSACEEISVYGVANAMRKLRRLGTRFSDFVYNYYLDIDTVPVWTSIWCPCPCKKCHDSWSVLHKQLHPTCGHLCCAKLPDPFVTLTVDGEEKQCITAERLEVYRDAFDALPRNSGLISEEDDDKEN